MSYRLLRFKFGGTHAAWAKSGNFNIGHYRDLVKILCVSLLLVTTLGSRPGYAQETGTTPRSGSFHATYAIRLAGITVGELTREFHIEPNGVYSFVSTSKATGIASLFKNNVTVEHATGNFRNRKFSPNVYSYQRTKGKKSRQEKVEFDYTRKIAIKRRKGKEQSAALAERSFDPLSYQLQLMADLRASKQALSYTIQSAKKAKTYTADVGDIESVHTPFANLMAVKVIEQSAADKKTSFWCAQELDYLPVKVLIEDGEESTVILLKDFAEL